MYLTLEEAQTKVDLRPEVITKAVISGKLAGMQIAEGEWLVDAASLMREYRHAMHFHQDPVLVIQMEDDFKPRTIQHLQELLELERQRSADLRQEKGQMGRAGGADGATPCNPSASCLQPDPGIASATEPSESTGAPLARR